MGSLSLSSVDCPTGKLREGKYDLDSALGLAKLDEISSPMSVNEKLNVGHLFDEAKIMNFLSSEKVHRVDVTQFIKDKVSYSAKTQASWKNH